VSKFWVPLYGGIWNPYFLDSCLRRNDRGKMHVGQEFSQKPIIKKRGTFIPRNLSGRSPPVKTKGLNFLNCFAYHVNL